MKKSGMPNTESIGAKGDNPQLSTGIEIMTQKEVMQEFKVGRTILFLLRRMGKLRCYQFGLSKRVFYNRRDILGLFKEIEFLQTQIEGGEHAC